MPFYLPNTGGLGAPFRGDWQDPTGTLLWSTDFSDSADFDLLTFVHSGTFARSASRNAMNSLPGTAPGGTPPAGMTYVAFEYFHNSNSLSTEEFQLNTASIPELTGIQINAIKFYLARSTSNVGQSPVTTRFVKVNGVDVSSSLNTSATESWSEITVADIGATNPVIAIGQRTPATGNAGADRNMYITGLRIYGVGISPYMKNDVIVHEGVVYRSLYDNNMDVPGTSVKWKTVTINP